MLTDAPRAVRHNHAAKKQSPRRIRRRIRRTPRSTRRAHSLSGRGRRRRRVDPGRVNENEETRWVFVL